MLSPLFLLLKIKARPAKLLEQEKIILLTKTNFYYYEKTDFTIVDSYVVIGQLGRLRTNF